MNARSIQPLAFALLSTALATACSVGADEASSADPETAESAYGTPTFKTLDTDSYRCTVSDGHVTSEATLSRSLARRNAAPNDEILFQDIRFAEPIFQAIERKNGTYGCQHTAGEGWSVSGRQPNVTGDKLPSVAFVDSRDEQWNNCDYNATQSLSVSGAGSELSLSFRFAAKGSARGGLAVSGTCTKLASGSR